jgi:hypothetical protein
MFYATHARILTSARSSRPYGRPSLLAERSPTAIDIASYVHDPWLRYQA